MWKVLVVEDERWIRKGIVAMLMRTGMQLELYEAESLSQALEVFQQVDPQIIFSDIMFPNENGCDFCEKVYDLNPNTKIVLISAHQEFNYARRAINFRAVEYLLKPVSMESLNHALERCIDEIQKRSENALENSTFKPPFPTPDIDVETTICSVKKIMDAMRQNCARHYILSDLADECHVTTTYFSSLFKKVSGMSPMKYLTQIRIERAKELIMATQYRFGQIARLVGYDDYQYFVKVFKKTSGYAPGEYRTLIEQERADENGKNTQ